MVVDREAELSEHLGELRTRIIRAAIYVIVGTIVAWCLYDWIYTALTAPVQAALNGLHTRFLLTSLAEGFMIRFQVSLIAGIILSAPLVIMEAWGFVKPALTDDERRPLRWVAPLCVLLFATGVSMAYLIFPAATQWFVSYIPPGAEFRPSVSETIIFIAKMLLAFGIVFEMPVVLLFLAKVGIVNSEMLKSQWKYSVVVISIVAAVATPSNDALSMTMMAAPLVLLYFASIFLVRHVETKQPK